MNGKRCVLFLKEVDELAIFTSRAPWYTMVDYGCHARVYGSHSEAKRVLRKFQNDFPGAFPDARIIDVRKI